MYALLPYHYWVSVRYVYRISDIDYQDHGMLRSSKQKKSERNEYIHRNSIIRFKYKNFIERKWVSERSDSERMFLSAR